MALQSVWGDLLFLSDLEHPLGQGAGTMDHLQGMDTLETTRKHSELRQKKTIDTVQLLVSDYAW